MIAICTFKTKIGHKKFITLIESNKLISAKNSDPGLTYVVVYGQWTQRNILLCRF